MFSTPVRTVTRSTQPSGLAQNSPTSTSSGTHKMSVLFKDSKNIKVGYFGILVFLDNQAAFDEVFGGKPTILDTNIITLQDSTSTSMRLYYFVEKCKLGVFLHICRKYYVGHESVDNSFIVQDMYHHLSEIN